MLIAQEHEKKKQQPWHPGTGLVPSASPGIAGTGPAFSWPARTMSQDINIRQRHLVVMINQDQNKTFHSLIWPQSKCEHCANHKNDQTLPLPPPTLTRNCGFQPTAVLASLLSDMIYEDTPENFPHFLAASNPEQSSISLNPPPNHLEAQIL